ncbi:hypothetical protein [Streptomyces niveus]|uniref:hypothetical protein n=1 Tax=Streptomyces niveus TaxID=193462 RepID=UPI0036D2A8C4
MTTVYVVAAVMGITSLVTILGALLRRSRPGPTATFRAGALWTWCPAEKEWTPHLVDAGARRCLSCKTPTPTTEETHG